MRTDTVSICLEERWQDSLEVMELYHKTTTSGGAHRLTICVIMQQPFHLA